MRRILLIIKDGNYMGIFSGILCLVCFCLLSAKAASARLYFKKLDKILLIVHKPVSVFLVIICFVHICYVVPILKNRNLLVAVSGIVIVLSMLLLISLCHMIKDRKKKILWHRIFVIFMALGVIGHFIIYLIDFNNYKRNVASIEINSINLKNVEDGLYIGECNVGYIYAKAEVKVKNGMIVSINILEHRNERGQNAENIINYIISEQEIDVNAVNGATNSSNVIKKAVEKAITNE